MKIEDNDGQHRTQHSTRTWTEACARGQLYVNEGREDRGVEESSGKRRLSLLALSTLMYFPYSTETHIAKRGRAGALVGAQLVCVLDRGG